MKDAIEYLMGERIGEILNESKRRKERHYKEENKYLERLEEKDRELVDKLMEDLLEWSYEDARAAYCAGVEDGIRIARRVLTV